MTYAMTTKTLGDVLAARRKQLHLEQKDVSERLRGRGVDRAVTTIAGWENGNRVPIELIKPLADALEMSPLELYELSGIAAGMPNWEIVRLTDGLPEKELKRVEAIEREIEALRAIIANLFLQRASAPKNVFDILEQQIDAKADELAHLETARDEARRAVVKADDGGEVRALALEELRALTLPRFWALPTVEQNQMLNRLLGNFRINVRDGEVIGFVDTSQE